MKREEQLLFCKNCKNQKFDLKRGITCNLTGDFADFDGECVHFNGNIDDVESDKIKALEGPQKSNLEEFISSFIPQKDFFITPIIIDICLIIFIIMGFAGVHIIKPDIESLIYWGGNFKSLTLNDQYWRLITSVFVHGSILHLLFNIYAFAIIGLLLEPQIGRINFLISYLITGFAASITSLWWNDFVVSVGASGAIFGMYGIYIVLLATNIIKKKNKIRVLISIVIFVGFNLLFGFEEGIDNWAHIGGVISGIVVGFSLIPALANKKKKTNYILNISTIALIFLCSFYVINNTSNPYGRYEAIMISFQELEEKAMKNYIFPYFPNEKYAKSIREDGINNWQKCKELVLQIDSIENLPDEIQKNKNLLLKYCNFRIKSFELLEQAYRLNTHMFNNIIHAYNKKIHLIIQKLLGGHQIDESLLEEPKFSDFPTNFDKSPIFIVNGIPVDNIDDIKPEEINMISILKGESAVSIYGDKGRYGVIIVNTH